MVVAKIYVSGTCAQVIAKEPIPSGLVGGRIEVLYEAGLWEDLTRTVVFRSSVTKDVITSERYVEIPPEVLVPGARLWVGFYGTISGKALPTVWANLGTVVDGTDPSGDTSTDPALPVWAQLANDVEQLKQSGPGGGIAVTGAKVGQTVTIAAVDEKGIPTAWQPQDFPDLTDYAKSVNGIKPDPATGDVKISIPGSGGNADQSGLTEYHAGNNLYDPDNLVGTHTINGSSVSGLSNWIPVKAKTKYVSNKTYTQYYLFDTEKNYISSATHIYAPVVITAPQDGFLLIKTNGDAETVVVEGTDLGNHYEGYYALRESLTRRVSKADTNTWVGKKWLAIGDSLTDPSVADKGYPYLVSKALGLTLTNVGASGKVMNYFVNLIPDYADDFDLVTVLLGSNNQGYNCTIGSLNDGEDYTTNESFYAQAQKIAEVLMEKYPSAVIAFLTPIRRTGVGEQNNNDEGYMINALGLTTEPYAEAVKEVADYYGLPCLDLYHNGINPKSAWMRQLYFKNTDGTHPNNEGHAKYLAPVIKAFLESLAPFGERVVVEPDIPEPDEPGTDEPVTTYTVTNTLTNAVNSNSAVSVEEGASYSATITANDGYELNGVTVTMGGMDISASAVNGGTITIASVTGNIVITAIATKTEVDSGEAVLVHSYLSTPVDGVLADQTGTFDLSGTEKCMANYSTQDGLAIEAGDSVSFKFVNVTRNTLYYSHSCGVNTSGTHGMHIAIAGNNDTSGRLAITPCWMSENPQNTTYGDADVMCYYRNADSSDTKLYSGVVWPKGETHTVAVTVNATDKVIKMYFDGTLTAESVMTEELQVDGFVIETNANCPFERLEIYKGIITDVG